MDRYFPDVNVVTEEELRAIPGIGREIARTIVEFRRRRGRIQCFEELAGADGITRNHLDSLRPWVRTS